MTTQTERARALNNYKPTASAGRCDVCDGPLLLGQADRHAVCASPEDLPIDVTDGHLHVELDGEPTDVV